MSFLAPAFLFGALAVALPVLFHLIRRHTRHRQVFSSLMFLQPSPPRLNRRSRLEDLLLLLLRITVLLLLAIGFGRPFLRHFEPPSAASATPRKVVVLLDSSASMRRTGLWDAAREQVATLVREAGPGDQFSLHTFGRGLTEVVGFAEWSRTPAGERAALVRGRLQGLAPDWSGTALGSAAFQAAELAGGRDAEAAATRREVILVSDLQDGGRLDALQSLEWPREVELQLRPVRPARPGNAGLQVLAEPTETPAGEPAVRVRVVNAPDSTGDQFQLAWRGRTDAPAPVPVYVPAGQERVFPVALPPGAAHGTLELRQDPEGFDNLAHAALPPRLRLPVLYFGQDPAADARQPLYFLQRAFPPTSREAVEITALAPDQEPAAALLQDSRLFVVADPPAPAVLDRLRAALEAGATALVPVRTPAVAPALARLLGRPAVLLAEARPAQFGLLAGIDFEHPLFAPFRDPRFSDFSRIHFWKYRRLDTNGLAGLRVLARLDDGSPALAEIPVGRGRVFILAAGWQPEDSQFALSSKFVPWCHALLELATGRTSRPAQFLVGEPVPVGQLFPPGHGPVTVRPPEPAGPVTLAAGTDTFAATAAPGLYRATAGTHTALFAVNLDPLESRTAPRNPDDFARLGARLARPAPSDPPGPSSAANLPAIELEGRQKLWRWLLAAAVGVLLLETWLAGKTARGQPATLEGSAA
ncbi:MAG: BatA domain-containing protein [Verrucomicrobiota bacterium]